MKYETLTAEFVFGSCFDYLKTKTPKQKQNENKNKKENKNKTKTKTKQKQKTIKNKNKQKSISKQNILCIFHSSIEFASFIVIF